MRSFSLEFLAAINPTNLNDFLATLTPCVDDFDFGDDLPADPVTRLIAASAHTSPTVSAPAVNLGPRFREDERNLERGLMTLASRP